MFILVVVFGFSSGAKLTPTTPEPTKYIFDTITPPNVAPLPSFNGLITDVNSAINVEITEGKTVYFDCYSNEKPIWVITTHRSLVFVHFSKIKYKYKKCTHTHKIIYTLIVSDVDFADVGEYVCQVNNKIKANYALTVKIPYEKCNRTVETTLGSSNVTLLSFLKHGCPQYLFDDDVCFKCFFISKANPNHQQQVMVDNYKYRLAPYRRHRVKFIIANVTAKDTGWYSCVESKKKINLGIVKLLVN